MDEAADFQQEVVDLLEARDGHFLLESGHHGKLWLELDSLFARQARTAHFAAELARRLGSAGVEAVCGPLVGGALLAQAVGTQMDVDLLYTEAVGGEPACRAARGPLPAAGGDALSGGRAGGGDRR